MQPTPEKLNVRELRNQRDQLLAGIKSYRAKLAAVVGTGWSPSSDVARQAYNGLIAMDADKREDFVKRHWGGDILLSATPILNQINQLEKKLAEIPPLPKEDLPVTTSRIG